MAMKQLIKQQWIKRIKDNPKTPPYYILNRMYEEATGKTLDVENVYRLRRGYPSPPKTLPLTKFDLVQPIVRDWAGLKSPTPSLPSYHEKGGVGLNYKDHTVHLVWEHGGFIREGKLVKAKTAIEKFCEIMEEDL